MALEILTEFPVTISVSLPGFDESGLLPLGDYAPNVTQFKEAFVDFGNIDHRTNIYHGWVRHSEHLLGVGLDPEAKELVNGSFTTAELEPEDVDIAVEVAVRDLSQLEALANDASNQILRLLQGPQMKAEYGCDAYPIFSLPKSDPAFDDVTGAALEYWTKWFGRTREGRRKGRVWMKVGGIK